MSIEMTILITLLTDLVAFILGLLVALTLTRPTILR